MNLDWLVGSVELCKPLALVLQRVVVEAWDVGPLDRAVVVETAETGVGTDGGAGLRNHTMHHVWMPDISVFVLSCEVSWVEDELRADGGSSSGVERHFDPGSTSEVVARHLCVDDVEVATVSGVNAPALEDLGTFRAFTHFSEVEVAADRSVVEEQCALCFIGEDEGQKRSTVLHGVRLASGTVTDGAAADAIKQTLSDLGGSCRGRHRGGVAFGQRAVEDDFVACVVEEAVFVAVFPEINDGVDELFTLTHDLFAEVVSGPCVVKTDGVRTLDALAGRPAKEVNSGGRGAWGRNAVVFCACRVSYFYPARSASAIGALDDRSGEVVAHAFWQGVLLDECGNATLVTLNEVNVALDAGSVFSEHLIDVVSHSSSGCGFGFYPSLLLWVLS